MDHALVLALVGDYVRNATESYQWVPAHSSSRNRKGIHMERGVPMPCTKWRKHSVGGHWRRAPSVKRTLGALASTCRGSNQKLGEDKWRNKVTQNAVTTHVRAALRHMYPHHILVDLDWASA